MIELIDVKKPEEVRLYDLLRELASSSAVPVASKEVCSTNDSSYVFFEINASRSSKVECQYNGNSFGTEATYSVSTTRWKCAPWTRGNPGYKINVIVDGQDNVTDEKSALARPYR